jgi:hypothetical protein
MFVDRLAPDKEIDEENARSATQHISAPTLFVVNWLVEDDVGWRTTHMSPMRSPDRARVHGDEASRVCLSSKSLGIASIAKLV